MRRLLSKAMACAGIAWANGVHADAQSVGYPEPVVHWLVEAGETCRDIVVSLYESERHEALVHRYNEVDCTLPLPPDRLLVMPLEVRAVPVARMTDSKPVVRARPPDGAWVEANTGMTFEQGYGVNTLQQASADLLFRDNSRILLQENTLVVLYDGASKSAVSPGAGQAQVAVSEGELRAAISSLHGPAVLVETDEGAGVRVRSSETTVRRRGRRTSVSVFDGEAEVVSASTAVTVPKEHGTTYFDSAPPWRPRPLPPPPSWRQEGRRVAFASDDTSEALSLSWTAVPAAFNYRVEVARDEAFRRVVVREEVPSRVHALVLSRIPVGRYYVRVQAVDSDGLLGIPSQAHAVWMLGFTGDLRRSVDGTIVRSAYEPWEVVKAPELEIATAEDAADSAPTAGAKSPKVKQAHVEWRTGDGEIQKVPIREERPTVQLVAHWLATDEPILRIRAKLSGRRWNAGRAEWGGLDAQQWERAAFRWQLEQKGRVGQVFPELFEGGYWLADVRLQDGAPVDLVWVDGAGRRLARVFVPQRVTPVAARPAPRFEPVGLVLPRNPFPVWGLGAPGRVAIGLRTQPGNRTEEVFVNASARVDAHWSVAADWQASVGPGLTSRDNGGLAVFSSTPLGENLHWGLRSGLRLPFSATTDTAVASTGMALQADRGAWSLLGGVDVHLPLSSSPHTPASTSYQVGVLGRLEQWHLTTFLIGEGVQPLLRSPGPLRAGGYAGFVWGSRWAASVVLRAASGADPEGSLSVQSSLQRHF